MPRPITPFFAWSARAGLLCLAAITAHATVFLGRDWETATPESQGVDAGKLQDAVAFLKRTVGNDGVRELVIVRHGRLIWKPSQRGQSRANGVRP